jgi:membrane protein DedA with SNARE-associated domain/rhodanese-related sulfurtransferase
MHRPSDLVLFASAIVAGMLIGDSAWFAAGRRYGPRVMKVLCRFSLTADTCVSRTERAFGRWGWSSLVIGRFIPGVALIAPSLAGALGMSWSKFLALTTAGAALFSFVVLGAGSLLRSQIDSILRQLQHLGWRALAALVLAFAVYVAWRWWRRRVSRAPDIIRVSVDELRALMAAGEQPLVVDVRGQATQKADPRRIPDAVAMSLDAIQEGRGELPRDRKIVVYCGCPNEASAAQATRLLLDQGYIWVRPLAGGLEAWSTPAPSLAMSASASRGQ